MRIFIAEDEPLAAKKLKFFLQKLGERAGNITIFDNGASLVEVLSDDDAPDVLFLDIQMPGLTGIEVLKQLQERHQAQGSLGLNVIITSAYDQYAIDGFNFGVTDYLLKPYTLDRLRQALAKVQYEPYISFRAEGRKQHIRVNDIVGLEVDKDHTQFSLIDGRKLKTIGTLTSFEQQLPAAQFARIQRSQLVNLKHVKLYKSSVVTMVTGEELTIGRIYRESFAQAIKR